MEKYKDDEFTQCIQSIFKDENDKKIQTILNLAETFFTTNMDKNDIQTIMANICQGDSDIIGGQKSKTLRFRKRMINRIIGGGSDEPDTCFICCEEYSEEKPSVEIHPSSILYKHNAHQTCINMWIQEKGDYATCPICRAPISDDMKSLALDGDVPDPANDNYVNPTLETFQPRLLFSICFAMVIQMAIGKAFVYALSAGNKRKRKTNRRHK